MNSTVITKQTPISKKSKKFLTLWMSLMLFQARSRSVPVSPSFFTHFTTTSTWVPAGYIVTLTPFTVSPARQAVMC